jgi:dTDP-4-amino-4,6-dideoxygalactose transaminase
LSRAGIETLIHYPVPPHLSQAYSERGFDRGSFPRAEELAETVLSLPMGPCLSPDMQAYVISALLQFA